MTDRMGHEYYVARKAELLAAFDEEARGWQSIVAEAEGQEAATTLVWEARDQFESLLHEVPYIGGDENPLTGSLLESARYLALYRAMQKRGRTAEEVGKLLYDAALARHDEPPAPIPPSELLTPGQLMERRRERAERSQTRQYAEDYVYEFVPGNGEDFDYGYDFLECAAQKFYHAQGADAFLPFTCYLDFPKSHAGLRRTMTLSEGDPKCDHRFKQGRQVDLGWPPPFLK